MKRSLNWLLLTLCVSSLLILPLQAQKTSGTITGIVTDPSGAVVANASVTVINTATGLTRTTSTDTQGVYAVPELEPGTYNVTVKVANFKQAVVNAVELHVASTTTANVKLEVGGASERVEVNANVIQVQTDSAALGDVIDNSQVRELPLNGRSFVQLTQLAPGVSGANNFDSKNKGLQGGVDFSVNGNATTNNLFLVDGANNNDVGSNRTILTYPAVDSIAEFKMLRNSYGAEYGQASGAVVTIVTKGGTNNFHGTAFYNGRNDALSAFEYFAARTGKKDVLRRNDFGGTIGGPIKKDKLFFFYSEEWNREKRGLTRSACLPTAAEVAGDFSHTSQWYQDSAGNWFDQCKQQAPNFGGLPAGMVDSTGRKLTSVDAAGALLLKKYPLPNLTNMIAGNNWSESEGSVLNWREENARVDYRLSKSHTLMGRFTQDTWVNPSPTGGVYWGDDVFPALTGDWAQPSKMIVGKLTSTIGGTIVNDAEFAYSNNRINIAVGGTNPGLQQQISNAIPSLYPSSMKRAAASVPTLWGAFGGYGGQGNYWVIAPWNNTLDIYTVRDDISKVSGNHTFKAGVFMGWDGKNEDNSASSQERPTFGPADWATNRPTGNLLANVLVPGATWSLSENSTNVRNLLRWRDYEFYFADTWKVRKNLTVDYGVRYSWLTPVFHPDGFLTSFQPSLYDPTKPSSDACNGIWIVPGTDPCGTANKTFGTKYSSGTQGPNRYLRNANHHLFAPRLGIAWDPSSEGKWAVRAGVGQFFQRERVSPVNGLASNAPFSVNGGLSRALGASTQIGAGGNAAPSAGYDPSSDVPNSWQWNVTVERALAKDTTLQVGYVGNRAIHQLANYDINAVLPYGTVANCDIARPAGVQYLNVPTWACSAFMSQSDLAPINQFRTFKNFNTINYWTHNGDASYHAFQTAFKTRYKRSQFTAAYTWSHSISNVLLDNSSGGGGNQNYTDYTRPWLDRGNSPINRPHIFVANATYFLPDLKGSSAFARQSLGGWELSLITTAASGNSQTIYYNAGENTALVELLPDPDNPGKFIHPAGTGKLAAQYGSGYTNPLRPAVTGQSCTAGRSGDQLYNPAAFTMVGWQVGTIRSNMEPRGYCSGPRMVNTDFSIDKNWKLTEKFGLQFRLDFFDLFNHANFRGDVGNFGPYQGLNCGNPIASGANAGLYHPCSPTNNIVTKQTTQSNFGTSTQTTLKSGRELQYGLKLIF
jgi:hypothetical protein